MDKNTLPIINNERLCLKTATKSHISQLQSWFNDSDQVLKWAGPSFDFPATNAAFHQQLSAAGFTSFSLLHNDDLIGFGQYQLHSPFLHLGRLVINPKQRGNGLASILLAELIRQGAKQDTIKKVSLFVYVDNPVAYKAYIRAGFNKTAYPPGKQSIEGCDYLTLTRK
jgi:ribosomal protein S18 acetylase RimI-like enzyme